MPRLTFPAKAKVFAIWVRRRRGATLLARVIILSFARISQKRCCNSLDFREKPNIRRISCGSVFGFLSAAVGARGFHLLAMAKTSAPLSALPKTKRNAWRNLCNKYALTFIARTKNSNDCIFREISRLRAASLFTPSGSRRAPLEMTISPQTIYNKRVPKSLFWISAPNLSHTCDLRG